MELPEVVGRHVAKAPTLHAGLTSKFLWMGGPDTGKTTHAKQVQLRYPKGATWDPNHEWKPSFCARHGFVIARTLEGLEKAARLSSRVVLQPRQLAPTDEADVFEEERAKMGDAFAWWCLRNLRGPCMVYFDEPHTLFKKTHLRPGLKELLRRGHKEDHQLAMGWSAWGAREMPNDLENVTHVVVFRPVERNDVKRVDDYFGDGFSHVAENLPAYWHLVRQADPVSKVIRREVFPPIKVG